MKLTRFCRDCGKELIYIRLRNDELATCDWDGPVPYRLNPKGSAQVVTKNRFIVSCDLDPDQADGVGYVLHRCAK